MAEEEKTNVMGILKESRELFVVGSILGILCLMLLPIPPFLLDLFFVLSISISILILLISFYSKESLDFTIFPTVLLFSTLLRLALNIASTRLILLNGSQGKDAAGGVIQAFGFFVVGGNYVVGFIVFTILVVINFVVITKGSGRVAEVAARFTLDAMPGKQLAIDADLNAGIITDKDAKARRKKLETEADFYGAMDGASKFIRGDAIAGILITIINIVGGFIIGMSQQGLGLMEALENYTILSVGDGLVAQIPSLLVSTAAGIMVTKVSNDSGLHESIHLQAFTKIKPLMICSLIIFLMAVVPGLPFFPFFLLSAVIGLLAFQAHRDQEKTAQAESVEVAENGEENVTERRESVPVLDALELEVGYDLISLVDQRTGGEFPTRIVGIRRQFANEMGVVMPPVHIRDNLKLKPSEYKIYIKGSVVGKGELLIHHSLALDPGMTTRKVDGIPTKDPTFGLSALWIPDDQKENAMVAGYTIVDLPSVMATHLMEVVRRNLHELFGRQELQELMDHLKTTHPKIVSDLVPDILPFGTVLKVCKNLLQERVSIRDLLTILEALAESAPTTKDSDELTEHVRVALGRSIAQQYLSADESLYAITLDRNLEQKLMRSVGESSSGREVTVDPQTAKSLIERIGDETKRLLASNQPPVVLTSQRLRRHLYKLIEKFIPNLSVLAHAEVAGHVSVKPVGMIGDLA